jgi:Intracellular proteinase inhibitor
MLWGVSQIERPGYFRRNDIRVRKAKDLNAGHALLASAVMRRIVLLSATLILLAGLPELHAIDVSPSKDTIPRSSFDTGGNHFSIFNGDPKRIQRANAVDPHAFDCKVMLAPNPFSLAAVKTAGPNPSLKIVFTVHNHAKKTYTLSFPTAQRWDFRIRNAAGTVIYTYSDNCDFEKKVGISMVNNDDKLSYTESVELSDLDAPLTPGSYSIEAVLANYPEMKAEAPFVVQD